MNWIIFSFLQFELFAEQLRLSTIIASIELPMVNELWVFFVSLIETCWTVDFENQVLRCCRTTELWTSVTSSIGQAKSPISCSTIILHERVFYSFPLVFFSSSPPLLSSISTSPSTPASKNFRKRFSDDINISQTLQVVSSSRVRIQLNQSESLLWVSFNFTQVFLFAII